MTMDERVALWDAINEVVAASGGNTGNTSVARQKAVVKVEAAVEAAERSRVNEAERERDHWASETRTRGVEREAAIRALETRDAEVARLRELLDAIGQLRPGTKWGLGRALELARAAATPEATTPAVPEPKEMP